MSTNEVIKALRNCHNSLEVLVRAVEEQERSRPLEIDLNVVTQSDQSNALDSLVRILVEHASIVAHRPLDKDEVLGIQQLAVTHIGVLKGSVFQVLKIRR